METWRTEWIHRKNDIALKLGAGECGGSYGEVVIILCTALSALAADVWPGSGIDRVRFVELLKDFAPRDLNSTRISIPLLVWYLRTKGRNAESEMIRKVFLDYNSSIVLTSDDVDKSETEILAKCQTLSLKKLREHSYANLLYGEIRSGYAHEYRPRQIADSWPMTQREDMSVSYINWIDDPDRHIHFHISWILKLTLAVAQAIDSVAATLPRNVPHKWWVYG